MRFGLFVSAQHPEEDNAAARFAEHIEQVRLARDLGFSSVFAGQHFLPAPFQMYQSVPLLARLAAETGDMRVGAGILLLPLLNPVEVAEHAATMSSPVGASCSAWASATGPRRTRLSACLASGYAFSGRSSTSSRGSSQGRR